MEKKVVFIILLSLCTYRLAAQNDIFGKVIDGEKGHPISNVFVCAYAGKTSVAISFTNDNGEFRIRYGDSRPDRITASHIGYGLKEVILPVTADTVSILLDVKVDSLDEVKVTAQAIEKHNDTVIYNVESFRSESDISLKDLLVKLPGIKVSERGTIMHKGKPISRFYIEGQELLGGRYSIATNNIDPRHIAKIELINNHQHIKALEGLGKSGQSAVNVILKSGVKSTWIVSFDVAGGYMEDTSALAEAKLMFSRFNKSSQSMFLLKGNNNGVNVMDELFNHTSSSGLPYGVIIGENGGGFNGAFGLGRKALDMLCHIILIICRQ